MHYNVIIIGGGPGGIFSAYELTKDRSDLRVAVFEAGHSLEKRRCPLPLPLRESHLAKIIILALSGKFLFNLPADCKQLA